MSFTYKQIKNSLTNEVSTDSILRKEDNAVIPFDEANSDYQEYLEWAKTNTAEGIDAITWDEVRKTRNSLLKSTDWTMISDTSVDQTAWKTYRQALRDIPETYKDKEPSEVVYPTQPSTAKAS